MITVNTWITLITSITAAKYEPNTTPLICGSSFASSRVASRVGV